jgi:hypothetical protein
MASGMGRWLTASRSLVTVAPQPPNASDGAKTQPNSDGNAESGWLWCAQLPELSP